MSGYRSAGTAVVAFTLVASATSDARGPQTRQQSLQVQQAPPVRPQVSTATPPVSPERAALDRYCVSCHNARLKAPAGGLALSDENIDRVAENPAVWEKALPKLRGRMMPPPGPGRARPDEATYNHLVTYLETSLDRAAAEHPNPGRSQSLQRLNRAQYRNAVRDLLSLDVDVSAMLPIDNASQGFDNVNVTGMSPTLVEQYLSASRTISRLAVGRPPRSPEARTVVLPIDFTQDYRVEGLPYGTRGGTAFEHNFPVDGEYLFQIQLSRDRDGQIEGVNEPHDLELMIDGQRLQLFSLKPNRSAGAGARYGAVETELDAGLTGRFPITAGPHTVAAAFLKKAGQPEAARQPFKADFNGRSLAAIFSITVAGPYSPGGPGETPSRKRLFICQPSSAAAEVGCAKTILETVGRRAFRRQLVEADRESLLKYYRQGRDAGGTFETGIEMALRAILASPDFLFRIERDPQTTAAAKVYRLSDVELASRLSFFLWSSIPDDQLLDLAFAGKLRDTRTLEQQVRRMLADKRSTALVDNFGEQWLYLRNLAAQSPDPKLFPDFDDNLRQAFHRETWLFFESIKNEDRSIFDLLNADYTFVNERLAYHYGIPNVYGTHFRRVTLPESTHRRGILGQASILTVTSYANRTSPVQRGKWVLQNLLGMPPPPPPPNVPPLKENKADGSKVRSVRERMVEHRANPVCASCHAVMDPIGLAIENFDAVGRWRTVEGEAPVDASGGFPDGSTFVGVDGLRQALLKHPELFVTTFTERLLTYALGRGLDFNDGPAVRAITRVAAGDQYRFSSMILGIVKSVPFQMRRSES
jgi:Protein of unknown function (DUF1592)/Protein of unknown function (DUF1588)/Protein of unknown function (DUF1585)/Protein of unknown function (DUF1595)/Protein of unknown function (DUF1587)